MGVRVEQLGCLTFGVLSGNYEAADGDVLGVNAVAEVEEELGGKVSFGGRVGRVEVEEGKIPHPGILAGRRALVEAGHALKV